MSACTQYQEEDAEERERRIDEIVDKVAIEVNRNRGGRSLNALIYLAPLMMQALQT